MEHKLNNFKADLHNVFVEGNASSMQMATVFMLLAVPVCMVFMLGYHSIKYWILVTNSIWKSLVIYFFTPHLPAQELPLKKIPAGLKNDKAEIITLW